MNKNLNGISKRTVTLVLFAVSFFLPVAGQDLFLDDTIRINEVVITSRKAVQLPAGFRVISLDTSVLNQYSHESLASVLAQHSGISVKSYGLSGLATPSFRGTGASHTLIQWNDIAINNPMLGQSDISLIPAGLFDEIEILSGGASMISGTGGIGGTIKVQNKPSWTNGTFVSLNPGIGSFGRYTGLAKVKTGNSHFQSVTRAFMQYGRNDFTFLNRAVSTVPVRERVSNSQSLGKGLVQELYYRKHKNVLSARLWYQNSERNLPASMLTGLAAHDEKQFDESVRTVINYEGNKDWSGYFLTGSYCLTKLNYINSPASINSVNNSGTLLLKAGFMQRFSNSIQLKTVLEEENTLVKSVNYLNDSKQRNLASATITAETRSSGRVDATLVFRELVHGTRFLIPDFSGGLEFRLSELHEFLIKANYSRSTKVPSMNDLYWNPGGNNDLRNETANSAELALDLTHVISETLCLKINTSLFNSSISDLIQWLPGPYSYWTAENVRKVSTMGVESAFSAEYSSGSLSAKFDVSYYLTKATTTGSVKPDAGIIGKQLIYIPLHSVNSTLHIRYGNFYSVFNAAFSGKRYTDAENSYFLNAYMINSFTAGYEIIKEQNKYSLGFVADNLFDVSYESVAWYPQPGRSFSLKLNVQFKI